MKRTLLNFFSDKLYIELSVAAILFLIALALDKLMDFIILALREFIVNVVKINKEELNTIEAVLSSPVNFNLLILSGVIIFLLVVRYLSVISSQRYLLKDSNKVD